MTEVVKKGILEAELELQRASEEKLLEEVGPSGAGRSGAAGSELMLCVSGDAEADPCGGLGPELAVPCSELGEGEDL